jgi:hypothetical protein
MLSLIACQQMAGMPHLKRIKVSFKTTTPPGITTVLFNATSALVNRLALTLIYRIGNALYFSFGTKALRIFPCHPAILLALISPAVTLKGKS